MPGLHAARRAVERLVELHFEEMASQLADVICEQDITDRILSANEFVANLSAFICGAGWAVAFSGGDPRGTKAEHVLSELNWIRNTLLDVQWWDESEPKNERARECTLECTHACK